jgi:hypothetical protein
VESGPDYLGDGARLLSVAIFVTWAQMAISLNKRFLVVLGACYSTYFATLVWDRLMASTKPGSADRARACVGFLTSSDVVARRSHILISKTRELVYPLDDPANWADCEWAPGYISHHSMYMRVFLYLWTYKLGFAKRAGR